MNKKKETAGYLTVFLSLTLTSILLLFMTLVRALAGSSARLQTEIISDITADSLLGEFSRAMLEQYDLFFIDTAYGTGAPSLNNTTAHAREYLEKNLSTAGIIGRRSIRNFTGTQLESVSIDSARYITQDRGMPLKEQIYAYFSADPLEEIPAGILAEVDRFEGFSLESGEWQSRRDASEEALSQAEAPKRVNDEGEEEEVPIENPASAAGSYRSLPVLNQIIGNTSEVSRAAVPENIFSSRGFTEKPKYSPENSHEYPEADAILIDEYIREKCGNYGEEKENGALKYQIEYILCRKGDDASNLEAVGRRLLVIREAANCIHIFGSASKESEARAVASVLACCLLNPELEELITPVILFGWAYVESVKDVRTLLAGGSVPLIKDDASWKTPISCILVPSLYVNAETGGSGMDYRDYLSIFLYLQGEDQKIAGLMDVMEMDVRQTSGNESFKIDGCVDEFTMKVKTTNRYHSSCELLTEAGYD